MPEPLVVPFGDPQLDASQPLYDVSQGCATCREDLLGSILFTLSRVEESIIDNRDEHDRFPAAASVAVDQEFVERPIVDEHGLAFEHVLRSLIPRWQPQTRSVKLKLTHDIDEVGIPFTFRTMVAHTLKRRKPLCTLTDLLSVATTIAPSELAQVRRLAEMSRSRHLHSAFFWKASPQGPHDSGYTVNHSKIQRVIGSLKDHGFELGVHPGYETFSDRAKLALEVDWLRQALRSRLLGGRQHYLRWNPDTWRDWESCGLTYDSSVGFAERFGFRAGTSFPYRPWCFAENRELNLIEIPLVLMDCTPVRYMKLGQEEGVRRIQAMLERMRTVGGVFTLLWHNSPLLDPDYKGWYESILDLLAGVPAYELPATPDSLW